MLDQFIAANRAEIIGRCQMKVAARLDPSPTPMATDHGVPMFLDQLLDELRQGPSADGDIAQTATQHGHDLLAQGYTVSQVVHEYGDICQAVTELAIERKAPIGSDAFRTLNRCLDDAIASAVTEYARQPDRSTARDASPAEVWQKALPHDLIKTLQIAKQAFEVIRSGKVGVGGSTGTVLSLSLETAGDLAERLLSPELRDLRANSSAPASAV